MTIILIPGANRGIGFAIAQSIAGRLSECTILLGCRNMQSGKQALSWLQSYGVSVEADVIQLDIENDTSILEAAAAVDKLFGRLDVLINNAIEVDLSMAVEPAARRNTLNSNFNNAVSSHILVTQVFVPLLRNSRHPRVVMVSSTGWSFGKTVAGELPPVVSPDYCLLKSTLNMLTLQLHGLETLRAGGGQSTYWAVNPGHCSTGLNDFRGTKDPLEGAEVVVRLLESRKGAYCGETFWEFENNELRNVPW